MRSSTGPTELSAEPISSIVHCMSEAAPQARSGMAILGEEDRRASPKLRHVTRDFGDGDQALEDRRNAQNELLGAGCALDREALGQRLNPEMSIETSDPSRALTRGRGVLAPEPHDPWDVRSKGRGGRGRGVGHGSLIEAWRFPRAPGSPVGIDMSPITS